MPYLPESLPMPAPTPETRAFWAHCRSRRLMFQACEACGHAVHPPVPRCPACGDLGRTWRAAPAEARVFSYTIVHHPADDTVAGAVPYNVVLVEFPGLDGVRLVSNVVDATPDEVDVGMALELVWEPGPGGQWLPRFRKAARPGGKGP